MLARVPDPRKRRVLAVPLGIHVQLHGGRHVRVVVRVSDALEDAEFTSVALFDPPLVVRGRRVEFEHTAAVVTDVVDAVEREDGVVGRVVSSSIWYGGVVRGSVLVG